MLKQYGFALALWMAGPAWAQETPSAEPASEPRSEASGDALPAWPGASSSAARPTFTEDLPTPSLSLERLPPKSSYEFGVALSYGTVSYWRDYFDAWIGFGLRGAWGRNVGIHRYGFDVQAVAEGPIGVHTTLALEPHLSWDMITSRGLLLGAGAGPAVLHHFAAGPSYALQGERAMSLSPSVVARVGWSQTWSRVGRRLFVYVEPKVRYVDGVVNPLASLVVGSGRGH